MADLVIPESGFAKVTLGGVTVELDLYAVYNQLVAIDAQTRDEFATGSDAVRVRAYLERVCKYLTGELGYGHVSHHMADKFDDAIFAAVEDLKKAPADVPTLE